MTNSLKLVIFAPTPAVALDDLGRRQNVVVLARCTPKSLQKVQHQSVDVKPSVAFEVPIDLSGCSLPLSEKNFGVPRLVVCRRLGRWEEFFESLCLGPCHPLRQTLLLSPVSCEQRVVTEELVARSKQVCGREEHATR